MNSNYTFNYNFSTYDLQNGFLITIIPTVIKVLDPNNIICRVNGQPQCLISINSSGTYINTTVTQIQKIYTLVVNNLRNPSSTQPFLISAKVAYTSGSFYYSVQSDYYNATIPYTLIQNTHFLYSTSSCKNSDISNMTIAFNNTNMPFLLAN